MHEGVAGSPRPSRRALCGLAAGALVAGAGRLAGAQGREPVSLMLNWSLYGEHAPFFLGIERGYFDREGIELAILPGHGSGPAIQAVASRSATFAYADVPTMIRLAARGAPVQAVGVALQTSPIAVISPGERRISAPTAMRGRSLVMSPGEPAAQLWPLWQQRAGLRDGEVKVAWRDAHAKVGAVASGQADALLGYLTDEAVQLVDATRKPVTALRFADYGVNLVSAGLVARRDFLRDRAELARRFMRATSLAFDDAVASPQAAVAALLRLAPQAGRRELLIAALQGATSLYRAPGVSQGRLLRVGPATMTESLTLLIDMGAIDRTAAGSAEDYYTNAFLP